MNKATANKKAGSDANDAFPRIILENAPYPILVIDPDTSIKYVNPAVIELTGFTEGELVGQKAPYPFWTKAIERKIGEDLERAMKKGAQRLEEQFVKKNGEQFVVEITSTPIVREGEFNYYLANWVDITARKRAEAALKQNEKWLATTLSSIGDAVIATDAEGAVTFLNPVAEMLTGWDEPRATGKPLTEVFQIENEHTGEPVENPLARVIREGVIVALANHTVLIAKDGTRVPIEDSVAPIADDDGHLMGVVLVFRDVSEKRERERELRQYRQQLEERVRERVKELQRLYSLSELVAQDSAPLQEILASVPELLPPGWQYPEKTAARIAYEDETYTTDRYRATQWKQTAPIIVDGETVGEVEVCYLEEMEERDEGPFLEEERELIEAVALQIGRIVGRRRAENTLRESERESAFKAELLYQAPVIAAFHDTENTILWANKAYEEATGSSLEEMIGTKCYHAWGLSQPCIGCPVIETLETDDVAEAELTPQNQRDWPQEQGSWLSRSAPIRDTSGELIGAIEIAIDITQRKRAENALENREGLLTNVFESMREGIFVLDKDFRYTRYNTRMGEISEIPREEVLGKRPWERFPLLKGEIEAAMKAAMEGSIPRRIELRYRLPSGKMGWTSESYLPLRDRDEEVVGVVGVVEDITARKRAENKLKQYSEKLEEMVIERTEALREAQRELLVKERLATIGQFSGGISHELRNPLAVIDSSAYYLQRKLSDADDRVQRHLTRIKNSVKSATGIIQSFRDLTRMERPVLHEEYLRTILAKSLDTIAVPAGVEVVRKLPDETVLIAADGDQLQMAFSNILKNAVDAMGDEGTLTVAVRRASDERVAVSFTDTGVGIASETLEKIFQPLFSTKAKGLGFGLAITKLIVDNHGGEIEVDSVEGEGTTVTVHLPKATQTEQEEEREPREV